MFKDIIRSTALTGEYANSFMSRVCADNSFSGDLSFISTLRALVFPRMGEDEVVRLKFDSSYRMKSDIEELSAISVSRAFYPGGMQKGTIYIHNFKSPDADFCMEKVDEIFSKKRQFEKVSKITDFYAKQFPVRCYINQEEKIVAIYLKGISFSQIHYLQCSILGFLPWYFKPEEGVTEEEMELIMSLREKTPDKYLKCIAKIAEKYDFRGERIKKMLGGFETKYEKNMLRQAEDKISSCLRNIESHNRSISELLKQKRDYEIRKLGIETKIAAGSEGGEVMDYFLHNKNIHLDYADDYELRFSVCGYVSYFDEKGAKNCINNRNSFVYKPNNSSRGDIIPEDDMEMLMTAIFLNQELKLKFCAAYRMEIGGSISGESGHTFDEKFGDCMPNPHINRFTCLGNHTMTINELIKQNNYIGAIEQCIASCKSLNFHDSTVMHYFMSNLYGLAGYTYNPKCIELPDGSIADAKGAISWLKEKDKKEEESHE